MKQKKFSIRTLGWCLVLILFGGSSCKSTQTTTDLSIMVGQDGFAKKDGMFIEAETVLVRDGELEIRFDRTVTVEGKKKTLNDKSVYMGWFFDHNNELGWYRNLCILSSGQVYSVKIPDRDSLDMRGELITASMMKKKKAITKDGILRFWPNGAHKHSYRSKKFIPFAGKDWIVAGIKRGNEAKNWFILLFSTETEKTQEISISKHRILVL